LSFVAGKGPAIKSATPSARFLRNFMKVAAGTSRLDELREAKIHHPPARTKGPVPTADSPISGGRRWRRHSADAAPRRGFEGEGSFGAAGRAGDQVAAAAVPAIRDWADFAANIREPNVGGKHYDIRRFLL
jgi:hypothetical protein